MIDCSLHGAMMSKHKAPTSFRPPSLRPQVQRQRFFIHKLWSSFETTQLSFKKQSLDFCAGLAPAILLVLVIKVFSYT